MTSKTIKISFQTVNSGKFRVIGHSKITEANQNVKEAMKDVVRKYKKNETLSQQQAAMLVLNA